MKKFGIIAYIFCASPKGGRRTKRYWREDIHCEGKESEKIARKDIEKMMIHR